MRLIMKNHDKFIDYIQDRQTVSLVVHTDPDGDAIGSALALKLILQQKNIKSTVYCKTPIAKTYSFLPGYLDILGETLPYDDTGIIALDSGDIKQLGQELPIDVNIDHHMGNPEYGKLNIINTTAAGTGEIIYDLGLSLGMQLTKEIAQCLYVTLSTDTGHFKYSNTCARTFEIVHELVKAGAVPSNLANNMYEKQSFQSVLQIGQGLAKMQQTSNGKIIWSTMVDNMDLGPRTLIDCLREVDTCEVAIVFKQKEAGVTKVSLRSKTDFDVRLFANKYGGGGHAKASGIKFNKGLAEVEAIIIQALVEAIDTTT